MTTDLVDAFRQQRIMATRFAGPQDSDGPNVKVQLTVGNQFLTMTYAQWATLMLVGYPRLQDDLEDPADLVTKEAVIESLTARYGWHREWAAIREGKAPDVPGGAR